MNKEQLQFFMSRYDGLSSDELAEIDGKRENLVEEATAALDEIIKKRGIKPKEIREEILADSTIKTKRISEKPTSSSKRVLWIFLAVGVLAGVVSLLRSPEKFYETLVSSLTQVVLLVAFGWAFIKIRDRLRK